jgi:hypothetical protein
MTQRPGIFPTFFLSGFECSTFDWGKAGDWGDKGRRDLNEELKHYAHADEDYAMLAPLGIAVAREGIPWPLVDKGNGEYDFRCIDGFLDAQRRHRILPIWDLCHYGYPDGLDPLIWVVPPRDRPDLAEAAHRESYDDAYLAWDVISGLKHPEYGGSPKVIDIIGLNNYSFGQMEYCGGGKPNQPLEPGDDRIRPLCDLIEESWKKYQRPCIVAETSGLHGGRPDWLNDVVAESLAAVNRGVDLHGICLFPAVDMTDWHTGEWLHMGIADIETLPDGSLMRILFVPYVEALHRWQKRLKRVTALDDDPFDKPVDLGDVIAAAKELRPEADVDWS